MVLTFCLWLQNIDKEGLTMISLFACENNCDELLQLIYSLEEN